MIENVTAGIILAAGQGKRMESTDRNKVTLPLYGKPMIVHTVELLKSVDVFPIIIVVGFAQESVRELFENDNIIFAEQKERRGTAHAVEMAMEKLPDTVKNVLIMQGDDSAFYKTDTVRGLIEEHEQTDAAFTFLTIDVQNPFGLGRIVRDDNGNLKGIVEEKDATNEEREINEINPACYIADANFLKKYIKEINPSHITGEYYLTSLIDIGLRNNERIKAFKAGRIPWRGVNTKEELFEAEKLYSEKSILGTAS